MDEQSMKVLEESWVNINGDFVRGTEATVSVWDRGFVYGDAVFEGVFVLDDRVVKLDEHIDRLFESATYLAISTPVSKKTLKRRVIRTVERNDIEEGYVRPKISRGEGPLGVSNTNMINRNATPNVFVIPQPMKSTSLPDVETKSARIVSIKQRSPQTLDPRAKTDNYLPNILAEMEVNSSQADIAILLDQNGFVTEANTANIFAIRGGELLTPPHQSVLDGITRRTVLELAEENDIISTSVQQLTPYDLYTAKEVFITGTSAGIVQLTEINGRSIADGTVGDKTATLASHLYDHLLETGTPIGE